MNQGSKIFINIDGSSHHRFDHLNISQTISGHHTFEISYRLENFSSDPAMFFEDTKNLIGKQVILEIHSTDWNSGLAKGFFRGLVTEISTAKANQDLDGDHFVIRGYSPTILLDGGPSCASFLDQDLNAIVKKTLSGYPENYLSSKVNSRGKTKHGYIVQYNESNFSFLQRLADKYGEWLFYDGDDLVFGQKSVDTSVLVYGKNLKSFELQTRLQPQKMDFTSNDYWIGDKLNISASDTYTTAKGVAMCVVDESTGFFLKPTVQHLPQQILESNSNSALREAAKLQKDGLMGRMVTFCGSSINPELKVGHVIDVKGKGCNFGSYILTKVVHNASLDGQYNNYFEAVPFDQIVSPTTNAGIFAMSGPQTAKVVDNYDPKGLSRVKVLFPWANTLSPWLRVLMPHAGAGKGLYFLPEIDEEVIVDFEGGDVEKPFVKGTMYNAGANVRQWNTDKNDIKAIKTRSGHTIELNDAQGHEMITIQDKNGNIVQIDSKENTITVKANETMRFSAKNIEIDATENISIGAGKNISNNAGEQFNIGSKEINEHADEKIQISAKKTENNSEEVVINSTSKNLTLFSQKSVDIQSNEKVKLF